MEGSTYRLLAPLPFALLAAMGCAHTHTATPSPGAQSVPLVHFRDDALGVSVDLPATAQFRTGEERGLLAQSPDTTEVRLFVEFPPDKADEKSCWQQLFGHIPADTPNAPKSPEELAAVGHQGLRRQGRVVYFSVVAHENRCYVAMVDGPADSQNPPATEKAIESTMKVEAPSKGVAADFEVKAGAQALSAKDYDHALEHFEKALKLAPDNLGAHFGAGLAAYLSGPSKAALAIQHFKPVLDEAAMEEGHEGGDRIQPGELHDALMFTGLAYAALHDYKSAIDKLEEASDRYPDDGTVRYNLACVLALSGDSAGALGELREALKREPALAEHAKEDDDLRSLRSTHEWKSLVDQGPPPPQPH